MKQILSFCFFISLLSRSLPSIGQNRDILPSKLSGIYFSKEDVQNGTPRYAFEKYKHGYTIWPIGFFRYGNIQLRTPEGDTIIDKKDLWAFTNHKGQFIRVWNNKMYKLISQNDYILYIRYSPTSTKYYFSETIESPIYRMAKCKLGQ